MDGTLDDPLWQQATPLTNFLQREPYAGQVPTERTEVRILYTKHEVYFGIACHDSFAGGPVATQLRRDVTLIRCGSRSTVGERSSCLQRRQS